MQDCHRQITSHWSLLVILLLAPILLWAAIPILPTFDDWTSLTSPSFEPLFTKEHFLFFGNHWRPFDAIIGWVLGLNPQVLFPSLNHILVVTGHTVNAWLLYHMLTMAGFNGLARNMATLFFYVTPAVMATVLAIDSMNQVYALLWGIVSFMVYVKVTKWKYPLWIASIFIATLCKENGLMWALICPILAYGWGMTERRLLLRDLLTGMGIMACYAAAILLLPNHIEIHPEYIPDELKIVRSIMKFLLTSFVTIDYVWLLHQPHRQLWLAAFTLLLSAPFMYGIFIRHYRQLYRDRRIVSTVLCLLIAVAPHLLTSYSMMHTYAGMPMIVLLVACAINAYGQHTRFVKASFLLLMVAVTIIDIHLWYESKLSGLVGKQMAVEAVKKTGHPVRSVYLIDIEEEYSKLSSFCVLPYEAFGWGLATMHETGYQWPVVIKDTLIERTADAREKALLLGKEIIKDNQYECVWIADHQHIDVIKK